MSRAERMPEASRYRASAGSSRLGFLCTVFVYAVILGIALTTISTVAGRRVEAPALATLTLDMPVVPPEAQPPGPEKVELEKVEKVRHQPERLPAIPAESMLPVPVMKTVQESVAIPSFVEPAPAEQPAHSTNASASKAEPAVSLPSTPSKSAETWEGHVLAALSKVRRYPRSAQLRRQQGVPYIRFVMDRAGHVLACRLERSSGFAELDREAVALPKRAQPLPPPPEDRTGMTIELVVPVEFFMR